VSSKPKVVAPFLLISAGLLFLHAHGFLSYGNPIEGFIAVFFANVALLSQISVVCLIFALGYFLIGLVTQRKPILMSYAALFFTFVHLFIFVDRRIFALYRFHANSLILNVLLTPGGDEAVHINAGEFVAAVLGTVLCFLIHYFLFRHLDRREQKISPKTLRYSKGTLIIGFACLNLVDRGLYAYADIRNHMEILSATRRIPFYQPFTIKKFAEKQLGVKTAKSPNMIAGVARSSGLNYPIGKIDTSKTSSVRPNVLWVMIDSWRFDAFSPVTSPRVKEFSEKALVFNNHYSGGNNTRIGVFSMFYGLPGSYWGPVLTARRAPFLLTRAVELGYEVKPYSATSLTFPEFRHTVFTDFNDVIEDQFAGKGQSGRDRDMTNAFSSFVTSRDKSRPFFATLLYDSSHSVYDYPAEREVFKPSTRKLYYATESDKNSIELVKNRYKNAVRYVDDLVHEILSTLKANRLLENTVVIITGDHGEEFYDHGFWGHFSAFTPEQLQVPLILYVPGVAAQNREDLTSHLDLPATVLGLIGDKTDPSHYSLGSNLLAPSQRKFRVSCGWDTCAMVDKNGSVVFGIESYNASQFDVMDENYKVISRKHGLTPERQSHLMKTMGEFRKFLK
jgi:membrane-anchored protein YejM (alkaline phosphatase superfamily)